MIMVVFSSFVLDLMTFAHIFYLRCVRD